MQKSEKESSELQNLSSIDALNLFNRLDKAVVLLTEHGEPIFFNQLFIEYFPEAEANESFFKNVHFYTQKRNQKNFMLREWIDSFKSSKQTRLSTEQIWLKYTYLNKYIPITLKINKITLERKLQLLLTIEDHSLEREYYAQSKLVAEHFAGQFITDGNGFITQPNTAFCDYTSLSKDQLSKLNYINWLKKQVSFEMPFDLVMSTLLQSHHWTGNVTVFNEEEATFKAILSLSMLVDPKNNIEHFIGVLQDLTDIKQAEKEIDQLSNFDVLTGLANRTSLNQHLKQTLSLKGKGHESIYCFFLLGLNEFDIINDTYGSKVGDELLVQVANKIDQFVIGSSITARLDGSHFAVLIKMGTEEKSIAGSDASQQAFKLLEEINGKYKLSKHSLHASASVGVCLYPFDEIEESEFSAEQIINFASMALYKARKQQDHFYFFDQSLKESAFKYLELIEALNHSELDNEFQIYFQGQANKDCKIVSAETLIRWFHPVLGIIPPSKFIPIAEKGRQIIKIGLWVLHKAFLQAKAWYKLNPDFRVSINISPVQFHEQSFIEIIIGLIKFTQIKPHYITLELTEGVLIKNSNLAMQKIQHLVSLGFEVSIDDFGTGYSSLSYLQKLPIHELKIDQSFIAHLNDNPDDDAIVESIIQLAHNKNLKIVAEGVETKQQAERLIEKSPDILLQGYLYSKPVPAEEFEAKFLRRHLTTD